jgi:SNF2 family DNA or RNA helicase
MYELVKTVSQPPGLCVDLFQHQLASVYNIEKLEREKYIVCDSEIIETCMGVHADETGYGKTMSMIAVILRDKMEWDMDTPFAVESITSEACGFVKRRRIKRFDKINATIIVVSPSIISHWEKELGKTSLRYFSVVNARTLDMVDLENVHVVLTVPRIYNRLATITENYAWKRFVFDEPGHVRISGMKEVRAGFYWFMTATPNDITTHHRNCKGSFIKTLIGNGWQDFENMFGPMIIKNDPDFVHKSFKMPETVHVRHECFNPILSTINDLVSHTIKTMIDAGNISGAVAALGGGRTNNLVELVRQKKNRELSDIESKIRTCHLRHAKERAAELEETRIRIVSQLEDLEKRFGDMMRLPCSICLDNLKSPVMEPKCQNVFCGDCLLSWMLEHKTCPMCRSCIDASDMVYITAEEEEEIEEKTVCPTVKPTKIAKTVEIINSKPEGRFIVFSAWDDTFAPICRSLAENNIPYVQITGTIKSRQKCIDSFKSGESRVIFLNSGHNGAGVNLQEATDIILFHDMSFSTQTQVVGRANRIGRTEKLYVHHLKVQT